MWDSIRRFRGSFSPLPDLSKCLDWIEGFINKLSPSYVPNLLDLRRNSVPFQDQFCTLSSPFSLSELLSAIEKSRDSSPGPDLIPYSFFKHFPKPLLLKILQNYNNILKSGSVPESWKYQTVIPIPKPGKDLSLGSSFRPIALSCCFLKIFERMIKSRLEWFIENNDKLPSWQFGFRKGRSCIDNLSTLVTDVQLAKSNKRETIACFLDVRSAYDNVLLPILFDKLTMLGVPEEVCVLIFNIMCERRLLIETPTGVM